MSSLEEENKKKKRGKKSQKNCLDGNRRTIMYYYDPAERPLFCSAFIFSFFLPSLQCKRMERRQRDNKFLFTQSIYLMSPMGVYSKAVIHSFLPKKQKNLNSFLMSAIWWMFVDVLFFFFLRQRRCTAHGLWALDLFRRVQKKKKKKKGALYYAHSMRACVDRVWETARAVPCLAAASLFCVRCPDKKKSRRQLTYTAVTLIFPARLSLSLSTAIWRSCPVHTINL